MSAVVIIAIGHCKHSGTRTIDHRNSKQKGVLNYTSKGCIVFGEGFSYYGGRNSVVRASEFRSEDSGFDPLVGQSEGQFFCPSESTLVQMCCA